MLGKRGGKEGNGNGATGAPWAPFAAQKDLVGASRFSPLFGARPPSRAPPLTMSAAAAMGGLTTISRAEVARHATAESLWVILGGRVYDLTKFAKFHPGGRVVLLAMAGRDATQEFFANHKADILRKSGDKYVVGVVEGETPIERGRQEGAIDPGPYAEKSFRRGWRSPYYNDSHAACQTATRAFFDRELRDQVEMFEEAGKPPARELYKKMGAAGILAARIGPGPHLAMVESMGIKLPGGVPSASFDYFHEMLVHQESARLGCPGFVDGIGAGLVIGLPPVLHFGPDWMKQEVAPKVLSGDAVICLAISEAFAGSDVKALRTTARRNAGGDFVVTGSKKWITNGTFADYFVTAVRTTEGQGTAGISLLLIERSMGVETKPIKTSYSPAAGTAWVDFDEVVVPARNLIGPLDQGFGCIMANFNHERCGKPRKAQCAFLLIWSSRRDLSTGSPSGKRASRGSLADSRSLSRVALAPLELLGHLPPPLRHSETSSMPLALAPTTTTPPPLGG